MNQKDIRIKKIDFATRNVDVIIKDVPCSIDFDINGTDIIVTYESVSKIERTSACKMFIAQIIEERIKESRGLKKYLKLCH